MNHIRVGFFTVEMKNKVSYVLNELDNMNEFEHISFTDQVNYMYEYSKLWISQEDRFFLR